MICSSKKEMKVWIERKLFVYVVFLGVIVRTFSFCMTFAKESDQNYIYSDQLRSIERVSGIIRFPRTLCL